MRGITSSALNALLKYKWPGNIRELQNVIERAANQNTDGYIDVPELPDYILKHQEIDFTVEEYTNVDEEDTSPYPLDYKKT